ncbi:hypothetical protein GQ607_017702 [Colletotrichum asianum]|uniref:Uncharacterized protein n=1 Tax=Colletotrichum asianum TaxID=702518 RepID=A0A8H3VVB0_9PEZI|nr:hypothetical protein GQ607_017702 [Colletotrichum asianum]
MAGSLERRGLVACMIVTFYCSGISASLSHPALVFGTKSPRGTDLAHLGTLGFEGSAINQPMPSVPCRNLRGMRCTHTVFHCTRRSLAADDRQHSTLQPAWCLNMRAAVSAGAAISACRSRPLTAGLTPHFSASKRGDCHA